MAAAGRPRSRAARAAGHRAGAHRPGGRFQARPSRSPRELGLGNARGGAGLGQGPGVPRLVVRGRRGKGHEDRGDPPGQELRGPHGAGAAHRHLGQRERHGHGLDVPHRVNPRRVAAPSASRTARGASAPWPRGAGPRPGAPPHPRRSPAPPPPRSAPGIPGSLPPRAPPGAPGRGRRPRPPRPVHRLGGPDRVPRDPGPAAGAGGSCVRASGKARWICRARRESRRVVMPGTEFCSCRARGTRRRFGHDPRRAPGVPPGDHHEGGPELAEARPRRTSGPTSAPHPEVREHPHPGAPRPAEPLHREQGVGNPRAGSTRASIPRRAPRRRARTSGRRASSASRQGERRVEVSPGASSRKDHADGLRHGAPPGRPDRPDGAPGDRRGQWRSGSRWPRASPAGSTARTRQRKGKPRGGNHPEPHRHVEHGVQREEARDPHGQELPEEVGGARAIRKPTTTRKPGRAPSARTCPGIPTPRRSC
jgi:hypothetical protein